MSEWREIQLNDLINVKHGYAFSGAGITTEETENVLVTPGNFYIGGGFKSGKFKYFNGEYPDSCKCLQLKSVVLAIETDLCSN